VAPEEQLPLIVLFGGGIESAALAEHLLAKGETLWPVYEHWGLHWDDCTLMHAHRFCQSYRRENLHPLIEIHDSQQDLLTEHWSVTGRGIPRVGDPPLAMEIPSRNLLLLAIAAARFPRLPELHFVIGTTADNKFSDGTRSFFDDCARVMAVDFRRPVRIMTPLISMTKREVVRGCDRTALSLSFSCVDPSGNQHCGLCYKCGRRKAAFREAGVEDPTTYAFENRSLT
jgi:7-cyano-7-deazaguanine synthase